MPDDPIAETDTDVRRGVRPLRASYALVRGLTYGTLVAVVVAVVVAVSLFPHVTAVQDYGPNVAADFFGILVTLVAVERFLAYQRTLAEAPLRTVALQRCWLHMNRLTHMLALSYKAAAREGSAAPAEPEALMKAWQSEARHLDFRKSAGPEWGNGSWCDHAANTFADFETDLHQIIDRYLTVLGADFPAAVENVIGDSVFAFVKMGPVLLAHQPAANVNRPINLFEIHSVSEPSRDSLAEFSASVIAMHGAYRKLGGQPLSLGAWIYDRPPAWGSGRMDDTSGALPPAAGSEGEPES